MNLSSNGTHASRVGERRGILMLRLPPPYGGGEILHELLYREYADRVNYRVLAREGTRRSKSNQGRFAYWKLREFVGELFELERSLRSFRPFFLMFSVGKGRTSFLRDSIFCWMAYRHGVGVLLELHGDTFEFLKEGPSLFRRYATATLARASSIRVLGESIRRDLEDCGLRNAIVADNGIDLQVEDCAVISHDGPLRLLFVGTLSAAKGFDLVVDAVIKLAARHDVEVDCLGPWCNTSFQQEIQEKLSASGCEDRFHFHGVVLAPEKWAYFQRNEMLVLPSDSEGQPLVILEAFAHGLGVIATEVGAVPDVVEDGRTGKVIPRRDSVALLHALTEVARCRSSIARFGEQARSEFKRRFQASDYIRQHEQWLQTYGAQK